MVRDAGGCGWDEIPSSVLAPVASHLDPCAERSFRLTCQWWLKCHDEQVTTLRPSAVLDLNRALSSFPRLSRLDLSDMEVDDTLRQLAALSSPSGRQIGASYVDTSAIWTASPLAITYLKVPQYCTLTDHHMSCLQQLQSLEEVSLAACMFDLTHELKSMRTYHTAAASAAAVPPLPPRPPPHGHLPLDVEYDCDAVAMMLLSTLPRLTSLDLSDCPQISGPGIRGLSRLTNLESLSLSNCLEVNHGFCGLSLPSLRVLDISCCHALGDDSIVAIGEAFPSLTELNAARCSRLSDSGLGAALNCWGGSLRTLNLTYCSGLRREALASIARMNSLTSLDVAFCTQAGFGALHHLAPLTNLQYLNASILGGGSDDALSSLQSLSNLQTLLLDGCKGISGVGLQTLPTSLLHLSLASCSDLEDSLVASALKRLPKLIKLQLGDAVGLGDVTMLAVGEMLTGLEVLDVHTCSKITDAGVVSISKGCRSLTDLNTARCLKLSDHAFMALAALPLTTLNVSGCWRLTDKSVSAFQGLPLTSLHLGGCANLTRGVLPELSKLTSLSFLSLVDCQWLLNEDVNDLMRGMQASNAAGCEVEIRK